MVKKIAVILITIFLLNISTAIDYKENKKKMEGFYIYTNFNGIEKISPLLQSIIKGIDIDNNPLTGINGKDIRVSIIILPYIQPINGKWALAISFALKIIKLGDDIKNGKLEVYFAGNFEEFNFKFGYYSKEEVPKEVREVITILPYILYKNRPEIYIGFEPVFENGYQNLSMILEFENNKFLINYYPAIPTTIKISKKENKFAFAIERKAYDKQTIRICYNENINLTLEDIPKEMAFILSFKKNYFEYIADNEFNASLSIEILQQKLCIKINYLPKHLITNLEEGYLYLFVNERKTKFIVCDDLEKPTNLLSISNISGEISLEWLSGATGYLLVNSLKGMKVEILTPYFSLYSQFKAEYFKIGWNISAEGYVFIDTNWEWLSYYSFNLTIDKIFGVLIEANMLRAEDFKVEWKKIPPLFTKTGKIEFMGDFKFSIMLNGIWYNIF